MTHLKHCMYCLFSTADVTCYLDQNNLEKKLKQWVIALNNSLLTAMDALVTSPLTAC